MTHTVADVARAMGVSKTTVHRWSAWFAGHLSEQARAGTGQPRAFTEADIATLRRAQRRLAAGESWEQVNARLAVITPEEEEEQTTRDKAPSAAPDEQTTAGQALMVLSQQQRLIDAQAGQLADQRGQLADQAARLREQAGQIAGQAGEIAALRERLARLEEAQRQQEAAARRRFRWPWEPRPE